MSPIDVIVATELALERDAISRALALLRPRLDVAAVAPDELARAVVERRPALVVGNTLPSAVREWTPCWILLYPDDARHCVVHVNGHERAVEQLGLGALLEVVDEAVCTGQIA